MPSRAPGLLTRLALAVLFSVLAVTAARAESPGDPRLRPGRVTEGTLLWRSTPQETPVPAPVLETDVEIVVTGIVARARVRQEFTNPGPEWAEGIYDFGSRCCRWSMRARR